MQMADTPYQFPDASGHFGPYGGIFVAETLMPALAITRDLEFGRLVKLDVVDLPPDHWDVMMAWRSGKRPNPAKERVLEAARSLARRWSGKRE